MPLLHSTICEYRAIQQATKDVLAELRTTLCADDTESSIVSRAVAGLHRRGLTETWYYDCPAFVLLGTRSCLSISGRNYEPAAEAVGTTNLITVDLSPKRDDVWGDCARSFFVENGLPTDIPALPEFSMGLDFLRALHAEMPDFVTRSTTFHELFSWTRAKIEESGFENLDFAGNVGHSIATRKEERQFIQHGNHTRVVDVPFFTFEPHVRSAGGKWGFKHEDIFFFDQNHKLERL